MILHDTDIPQHVYRIDCRYVPDLSGMPGGWQSSGQDMPAFYLYHLAQSGDVSEAVEIVGRTAEHIIEPTKFESAVITIVDPSGNIVRTMEYRNGLITGDRLSV